MSELEGEVERVLPLFKTQDGTTFSWAVKLKGREAVFAIHQNWFALYGSLKPGDRVRYVVSKAKLGEDLLFDKLRKVEKEAGFEEEVAEAYGED